MNDGGISLINTILKSSIITKIHKLWLCLSPGSVAAASPSASIYIMVGVQPSAGDTAGSS